MPCRKAGHTRADRAVTRPSNVTSRLKTDANAGTTAASGNGIPAPGLVGRVEVAELQSETSRRSNSLAVGPRKAVVGESGLSRTRAGVRAVFRAKARTWCFLVGIVRGKAVVTRLRHAGSDDPVSRNERAEGRLRRRYRTCTL